MRLPGHGAASGTAALWLIGTLAQRLIATATLWHYGTLAEQHIVTTAHQ